MQLYLELRVCLAATLFSKANVDDGCVVPVSKIGVPYRIGIPLLELASI